MLEVEKALIQEQLENIAANKCSCKIPESNTGTNVCHFRIFILVLMVTVMLVTINLNNHKLISYSTSVTNIDVTSIQYQSKILNFLSLSVEILKTKSIDRKALKVTCKLRTYYIGTKTSDIGQSKFLD